MKKTELIAEVAEKLGETKKWTRLIVNATFEQIANSLAEGENVSITDFGSFSIVQRHGRKGTTPRGMKYAIGDHKGVRFTISNKLKKAVW